LNIACKLLFNAQLINSTLSNRSVAMQPNKTKLALKIGAVILGAAVASSVSADPFTATITTIDDVTITPVNALTFGSNIFTTASTSCTMLSSGSAPTDPGTALMEIDATTVITQGLNYGSLTGDGCVNAPGSDTSVTPGVWEINGAAGGSVSILISEVAQVGGDFTYAPSGGCYVLYNGDTTGDADSCTTLIPGTVVTAQNLFSTADLDTGAATTLAAEGQLRFTLGGVISIGATGLTAETDYDLAFQVDVTY
jgi:hypothetical protein